MKKTMLALMATVGLAFGAKADVLNSTGFENYTGAFNYAKDDTGGTEGSVYWVVTNAPPDLGVTDLTAYGESAKPEKVPDAFEAGDNDTYLKVDTNNEVLYRSVAAVGDSQTLNPGTEIGVGGLYFDANVQFTASDGDLTYDSENDKLVVWLKATEGENPTTNLMVTAGVWNNGEGKYEPYNFEIDGTYSADTWYRLTVKAASVLSEDTENNTAAFEIYIDDSKIFSGETSIFYSMVQPGTTAATTLTAVGFQGTGAVDNLVWTTDNPFPVVPPTTVDLTVTATGDTSSLKPVSYAIGGVTNSLTLGKAEAIAASVGDEIAIILNVIDGATPTVSGYELTKSDNTTSVSGDDCYTYTFSVTVTAGMISDDLSLTIAVAEDSAGSEVEAETETGATLEVADNGDGTLTITVTVEGESTTTKADIKLTVPNGDALPFDVTRGFTIEDGESEGTFTATLNQPTLAQARESEEAEPEAEELFTFDGDAVTVSVDAVPGLFYGVSCDDELPLVPPEELTQYDGTNKEDIFKVGVPSATKGFFKVYVGTSEEVPVEE